MPVDKLEAIVGRSRGTFTMGKSVGSDLAEQT
jgi:hypothetical protein